MAVPVQGTTMVNPEGTPLIETPAPSPASIGGTAQGHALSESGEKLFAAGHVAFQKAARTQAESMETVFQIKALQLRDQYRQLEQLDAVKAHESYSTQINRLRDEHEGKLTSQDAVSLYRSNSQRIARYVQESVDSWFETQNREHQKHVHANGVLADARTIAGMANVGEKEYDPAKVEELLSARHKKAEDYARLNGMEPEEAKQAADNEVHTLTDALFKQMMHKNTAISPATMKSELDKYTEKGWVEPGRQRDSLNALNGHEAQQWVNKAFANFTKIDHEGNTDPHGYVPHSQVDAAVAELDKNDPNYKDKVVGIERAWARSDQSFQRRGHEMQGDVLAQKAVGDKTSDLWSAFNRLYPITAQTLDRKQQGYLYQDRQRAHRDERTSSLDAYGYTRMYIDSLTHDEVKDLSKETVKAMMVQNYHGPGMEPSPTETSKALEYLERLKTGKLDPLERRFDRIAYSGLSEAYKGNRAKVAASMNRAYYILDEAYAEAQKNNKPIDEAGLRKKIVDEFKKGDDGLFGTSIFGTRRGESAKPRERVQTPTFKTDAEVEAGIKGKPKGFKFNGPDGKEYVVK